MRMLSASLLQGSCRSWGYASFASSSVYRHLVESALAAALEAFWCICQLYMQVLDAPHLLEDFYLNLIDWSSQNILAVGLESSVYLWSATTSKVSSLTSILHLLAQLKLCSVLPNNGSLCCRLASEPHASHIMVRTLLPFMKLPAIGMMLSPGQSGRDVACPLGRLR